MYESADGYDVALERVVERLEGALSALLDGLPADLGAVSDAALVRGVREVEAVGRGVDALRVLLAGEVAHRSRRELGPERLAARHGSRSAVELVQRLTGVSAVTASQRQRLGLAVRPDVGLTGGAVPAQFAHVARSLVAGELALDAAQAIVRALESTRRVATAADVSVAEAELVAAATGRAVSGPTAPDGNTSANASAAPDADPSAAASLRGPADTGPSGTTSADPDGTSGTDSDGTAAADRIDAAPAAARRHRAPRLDADSVRLQARVWAEYLDPDGAVPDERDVERRFLTFHAARHGLVPVSGLLLPEVAAALRRYADACTNPRTAAVPGPSAGDEPLRPVDGNDPGHRIGLTVRQDDTRRRADDAPGDGAGPTGGQPIDHRSRAQLMHDVLATVVSVAGRVADAPSVAGNAPTLVVVARADELETGRGTARTDDGAPVSIAAARQVACAGAVQRVSVDESGRVAGIWAPDRCFTGPQRRAIALRDGGCVIPGCHVPISWCETHHVTPHADDPDGTHTDNGVLLCWFHHRTIDSSGWAIRMLDGIPWTRPPTWLDPSGRWTRHSPGPPLRRTG